MLDNWEGWSIVTVSSKLQLQKHRFPIALTFFEMLILLREQHPQKTSHPINIRGQFGGKTISCMNILYLNNLATI